MKSFPIRGVIAAATIALTGLGATAYAQGQPAPQGPQGQMGARMQRPDPAQMAARHAQHLRDALQLRPDQESALAALMASMQPPAGGQGMRHGGMGGDHASMTTPQRLDMQREHMAKRQAMFDQHAAALKRFYAALSPAQQKAFDAMGPMGGGHKGMRGGHGGRGGGHGGHGGHGGPGGHPG